MSPRLRLLVALLSTSLVGYVLVGTLPGRVRGDTTYGQLSVFNEVVRIVLEAYVEPINLERTMAGARLGLTDALDGDSAYLDPEELKAYQQPPPKTPEAEIGVALTRRYSFLMVVATRPGSPAEKAGLKPGDIIKTIDGRHTRPLPVLIGQRLLRGAPGSTLKLTLLRAGVDPVEVSIVRERLGPTPPSSKILPDGTGYLRLPEFQARASEEVRGELEALHTSGARNLVLDLRGSAFGSPQEGVKVAELFLKGGVVTKLQSAHASEQVFSAEASRTAWPGPLAVLIDNGTAGAAEIVAAAVSEAGRASLVGAHSFGRAANQKLVPLVEGGLVLTVSRYLSPKGTPIHGKGLEPTVPVEPVAPADDATAPAAGAAAPAADPVLEKALEILRGELQKAVTEPA